jgi:hypothetical protein
MPKLIDVRLFQIVCNRNGFGGSVDITGNIFGATFDDPNVEVVRKVIFPFPGGPIRISENETVQIRMDESVTFLLSSPFTEPAGENPKNIRIGGDLNNGLGGNFLIEDFTIQAPLCQSGDNRRFDLEFTSPNLGVTLGFHICLNSIF